jgi:hypothetical protein
MRATLDDRRLRSRIESARDLRVGGGGRRSTDGTGAPVVIASK